MRTIEKYSLGVGDRFAHQAVAQLQAFVELAMLGVRVVPVWNKSHREHTMVGSQPESVRRAADAAVQCLKWSDSYYVDADHVNQKNVEGFIGVSDFFTIDVADEIGRSADESDVQQFVARHSELIGTLSMPGMDRPLLSTRDQIEGVARTYLLATQRAGEIYRHIRSRKGTDDFVTEVSMDETDQPQRPMELLVILAAFADEQIPIQTIAPKFTGRFNKGVDFVGDVRAFDREFREDIAVLRFASQTYGLPASLKLSVHSGSDKFSIYAPIHRALVDTGAGLHLKTAGTTWLEELIGLAEAGGGGLALAKQIYASAHTSRADLCAPYASVIDIDESRLPDPAEVADWDANRYVASLRHDPTSPLFNTHVRQLLHVGYKMAAKLGDRYRNALIEYRESIATNVTRNLLDRHMKPLFIGPEIVKPA